MRIISPFHDYYDCMQGQGQDRTLVYLRQPREERLPALFPFTEVLRRNHYFGDNLLRACFIIGFCGRVHPVLRVQHTSRTDIKPVLCYTLDEVDNFVRDVQDRDHRTLLQHKAAGLLERAVAPPAPRPV